MIDPIGSNLSSLPSTQPVHQAQIHQAEEATAPIAGKPAVNIELSDETRVRMLEGQGSTIAEIALELDLDELTVRSYLAPIA
jgi:DNA-binding NarL/FixJ family response regulator